jgi:hypothetical protein
VKSVAKTVAAKITINGKKACHFRSLVSVGIVGAQHPQIFSKTEFETTDFKGNPS